MRRDAFLKTCAALLASGALPMSAEAAASLKMIIPANPGGGWDTTGRALGKALQDSGAASTVTYENKGGAAGVIGLSQFANAAKGDGNAAQDPEAAGEELERVGERWGGRGHDVDRAGRKIGAIAFDAVIGHQLDRVPAPDQLLRQRHGREEVSSRAACHQHEFLHSAGASGATALR